MLGALHPPRSHTQAFPFLEEKKVSLITMIVGVAKSWVGLQVCCLWAEGLARLRWCGLLVGLLRGWNLLVTFRLW